MQSTDTGEFITGDSVREIEKHVAKEQRGILIYKGDEIKLLNERGETGYFKIENIGKKFVTLRGIPKGEIQW